jgi:hypothetical protein
MHGEADALLFVQTHWRNRPAPLLCRVARAPDGSYHVTSRAPGRRLHASQHSEELCSVRGPYRTCEGTGLIFSPGRPNTQCPICAGCGFEYYVRDLWTVTQDKLIEAGARAVAAWRDHLATSHPGMVPPLLDDQHDDPPSPEEHTDVDAAEPPAPPAHR